MKKAAIAAFSIVTVFSACNQAEKTSPLCAGSVWHNDNIAYAYKTDGLSLMLYKAK